MNCANKLPSSVIREADSCSRTAGRGSGSGGFTFACSAGLVAGVKGDSLGFGKGGSLLAGANLEASSCIFIELSVAD